MLETYEAYADYSDVMRMTEEMVAAGAQARSARPWSSATGARSTWRRPGRACRSATRSREACGVDPLGRRATPTRCAAALLERGAATAARDDTWPRSSTTLLSHFVEPHLVEPTFLVDYPVELSPLARAEAGRPVAGRALRGVLRRHGDRERLQRAERPRGAARPLRGAGARGAPATRRRSPVDHDYVEALRYGMPPTGGLGVGIDRVAMLLTGGASIREVVLFPALRDRG